MLRSDTPEDKLEKRQDYVKARWEQLSELSTNWGDEAIKYLLLVNTAAMAGALSFIGAMPHLRQTQWPRIALSLFVFGVLLVGIYHACRYHRTEWLFSHWREATEAYSSDKLEWNDLVDGDRDRIKRWVGPLLALAYGSFLCFFAGVLIAAFNFHDITNAPPRELSHEHTQTNDTSNTKAPDPITGHPRPGDDQGPSMAGSQYSGPEHASPGPRSAAETTETRR